LGNAVAVDIVRLSTVVFLATATYLSRFRGGSQAAFWFGFALFGWAWYILHLDAMTRWRAMTSQSIVSLVPAAIMDFWTSLSGAQSAVVQSYAERLRMIHQLCIFGVATIGGVVCWLLERKHWTSSDDRS
jgi:hypothetical protein